MIVHGTSSSAIIQPRPRMVIRSSTSAMAVPMTSSIATVPIAQKMVNRRA